MAFDAGPAAIVTRQLGASVQGDALNPSSVFEGITSPAAIVLVPPAIRARLISHREVSPSVSPNRYPDGAESIAATDQVNESVSYLAACPVHLLDGLLREAERVGCSIGSITTADYAWGRAACEVSCASYAVVTVQLKEAAEIRIIAARGGRPEFWRRLPLRAGLEEITEALESVASHMGVQPQEVPVVVLGDQEFRGRVAEAATASFRRPIETTRLAELGYAPAAVAAAYAGTGPRFVPPEILRRARARTRRNGVRAAALAIFLLGLAGFLDILDLQTELDTVQAARRSIDAPVSEAMTVRESIAASAAVVSTMESLRETTPRWTMMLGSLADATPRTAYVRSLRASRDSVYIEVEGRDVAAVVEGLRAAPSWRGLRTVSPAVTEVGQDGSVTERVMLAGEVDWASNPAADPSP